MAVLFFALAGVVDWGAAEGTGAVGSPTPDSRWLMPSGQFVQPSGDIVTYGGRPVDLVVLDGGRRAVLKDHRGLALLGRAAATAPDDPSGSGRGAGWTVHQQLEFEDGTSMHGVTASKEGRRLFATTAKRSMLEVSLDAAGEMRLMKTFDLPGVGEAASYPCGVVLSKDESTAYVCLSMKNVLAVVDLVSAAVAEIPVGIAPYAVVLAPDGKRAYVTNWGGRRPVSGDATAPSAGTDVVVDDRGVAATGAVSIVDLQAGKEVTSIAVGLHPSDLVLTRDGETLYVANANSDTVSVIDTVGQTVSATIRVRPDPALPFGSAPNALVLDEANRTLYVALGGNNAIAVVAMDEEGGWRLSGCIPAGWFPGALALGADQLFIANVKGFGSREPHPAESGWHVKWFNGAVQRVTVPVAPEALAAYTRDVAQNGLFPQMLRAAERSATIADVAPVPVPTALGRPSVFEHVVYVIKENRTYDQVLGDLPQGNGDPSLCIFPREITPNHHALAEEFVLLDNWYCNGVNSADGHAWSTEGNVTDYLEKSFGGFTRSYTWGDDPLSYSSSGFIWDKVLAAGLSFRNYGEFDYAEPVPEGASFARIYEDFLGETGAVSFKQKIGLERLRDFSCREYPGWNMAIPDVLRASVFLKELAAYEENGRFPNFSIVYLPQDHTSGTKPGMPTPAAHVADNDLALGRIVEGLSQSRFWSKTCIFVVEDDPQAGFDHVDGHRSLCFVVSPYSRRGAVVSDFYNQTSVLHTMARILGLPPMNQMDALAPLMTTCFQDAPDTTPYRARPATVPLDALNPPEEALAGPARRWAKESMAQNFAEVDGGDEDTLNRILWHAMKGMGAPYPAHLAGAHGTGLAALKLVYGGAEEEEE